MTDLTQQELSKLFRGARKEAAFDADSVTKDVARQRRIDCQIEIDIHARLLEQRKVAALERIADTLGNMDVSNIGFTLGQAFETGQRSAR